MTRHITARIVVVITATIPVFLPAPMRAQSPAPRVENATPLCWSAHPLERCL